MTTDYIKKETNSLLTQQSVFNKRSNKKNDIVSTSYYEIAILLTERGKPCSNGEIIKKSLDVFAKNVNDSSVFAYVKLPK